MKMSLASLKRLAIDSGKAALKDDISGRLAQPAYYFFLSLLPALIFFSALLGMIAKEDSQLEGGLLHAMAAVLPESALGVVRDMLAQIKSGSDRGKISF